VQVLENLTLRSTECGSWASLVYPHDFKEFLQKSSNLCDSTTQQRDELLKRMGESARPFEPSRRQAILEVYRTYQLE
jgi:hypothetical protein